MKSVPLNAFPRTLSRRGGSKKLRDAGRIPAVIYGGQSTPLSLEVDRKAIEDFVATQNAARKPGTAAS